MTWLAAWQMVRRFWPALPIVGLAIALFLTRETLASRTATLGAERASWKAERDRADAEKTAAELRFAQQQGASVSTFASTLASREPVILHSTDTVREYAQTPAGRAACLAADRVLGIDQLDAALFHPEAAASAGAGAAALPAEPGPAPAGR
jgi:hypothetical protein